MLGVADHVAFGKMKTKFTVALVIVCILAGCAAPRYTPPRTSAVAVYSPPLGQAPAASTVGLRTALEGCIIVAKDGQMLGVITSNGLNPKSILNKYGTYGSEYSATSIWNEYGQYGGQYSSMSPFNEYTSTPPSIITPNGDFLCYLTVNKFKTPCISPHALIALLE